jgi:alanine racemase
MDLTLLDVGELGPVETGDEVVILGRQGDSVISADDLASDLSTISYEIVSTIAARVPRLYRGGEGRRSTPG